DYTIPASGACPAVVSHYTITVTSPSAPATISGTNTLCVGSTSSLTASISGGAWASANTAIATVSASGVVTAVASGSVSIDYTIPASGACPAVVSHYTITISSTNSPFANNNQTFCAETNPTLSNIAITGTSITWYANTTTNISLPSNTILTNNTTYYASQTINGCESSRIPVTVTVLNDGFYSYASAITLAINNSNTTFNTTAQSSETTTAIQNEINPGGNYLINQNLGNFNPNSGTLKIASGEIKTHKSIGNVCSAKMYYRIYQNTAVPSGFNNLNLPIIANCIDTNSDGLQDTFEDGFGPCGTNDQKWKNYNINVDLTQGLCSGSYILEVYYSYTGSNCSATMCDTTKYIYNTSGSYFTATFSINATPAPSVNSPINTCQNSTPVALSAVGNNIKWYTSATGGVGSAIAPIPDTSVAGTFTYYATQTQNGCESTRTPIVVTIQSALNAGVINGQNSVCIGNSTSYTSSVLGGFWASSDVNIATIDNNGLLTAISAGNVTITYTLNGNGICPSVNSTKSIIVKPLIPTATIQGNNTLCVNTNTLLTASIAGGTWSSSNSSIATVTSTGQVHAINTGMATIYYTLPGNGTCSGTIASFQITIYNSLSAGVISGTSYLCVNDSTTLSSTISSGTWSSSNNAIATVDNNGFVHAIKSGNVTITYTVTGNSPCGTTAQSNYYITIFNLPKPNPLAGKLCIDPTTGLAVNAITLHSYLDATQHSFTWMDQLGNVVGTSANLTVTIPGDYTILAQNTITGCISDPVSVNVGAIEQPDVIFEVSDYFEDNQSITIIPKGNINPNEFIYSIDNGPFQSSNVFENVATGTHTITIKNPEGCVDKTITAFVINYPKYFTPNGDGVHDTWYIKNMNLLGNSKITIFDRYNTVVRIINNPYQSWDGTANGVLLPASDYWFVIEYTENNQPKVFKSHFSLKR
ncbi:T9SS type B sorting domain-containing protein, partial [Flavobacterium croceum]|uniref:T9SS type B sorting domain-containing protein n=1 Tax=Flavobacterium croceum TaxID=370975 RepID=UPI0024A996CC